MCGTGAGPGLALLSSWADLSLPGDKLLHAPASLQWTLSQDLLHIIFGCFVPVLSLRSHSLDAVGRSFLPEFSDLPSCVHVLPAVASVSPFLTSSLPPDALVLQSAAVVAAAAYSPPPTEVKPPPTASV